MGMNGFIKKVTGSLWGHTGPGNSATSSPTRDPKPAGPDGLSLRARFAPSRAGAPASSRSAKVAPDDPMWPDLQAMEQRRSAALDKLKQVNAGLRQVPQAVPAQPPQRRTLASFLEEERALEAAEKARGQPAPQAEPALSRMRLRGGRRDSSSGMATAAAAWLGSQPATPPASPDSHPAGPADGSPQAQAAAPPRLTRSPRGRHHGSDSDMALAADAWLARHPATPPGSPGALLAGPEESPPQAPAGKPPKQVRFAHAEVRTFASGSDDAPGALAAKGRLMDLDPKTGRPMSKDPVRTPVPAGPTAAARTERAAKQAAKANQAAVFATLGRLQALQTQDPARWQQALQDRRLPEGVLDPKTPLDAASVQEVFDLHRMFREEPPDTLQALFGESVQTAHHARETALNPGAARARVADLLAAALAPMDDDMAAEPPAELAQAAPPAPLLSDDERRVVAEALRGGGRAARRLADRAARADLAVRTGLRAGVMRRLGPGAPRPLEGERRKEFNGLVYADVEDLAAHAKIDKREAAGLLLRAVTSGALGTAMHPDDRTLMLGLLTRLGPEEPTAAGPRAADVPWANEALADWWPALSPAHKQAIEQAFAQSQDMMGITLLDGAESGNVPSMQALHDHLFEHYRFQNGDRLYRISDTDTGRARNHIGVITTAASPDTSPAGAADPRDIALQAELEKIYKASDTAKKNHRYLHGDPQPSEEARRLAEQQRAGPSG